MTLPDNLREKIDDTRIEYVEKEHGFSITGSAFICEFESQVDPENLSETVTEPGEPWNMFGIPMELRENGEYWKVVATLFHTVEDNELTGASEISFEVAPGWMRVYPKEDTDTERLIEFLETLDDHYPLDEITFSNTET